MSKRALLVIDPQNDYFEDGLYPLWNTQAVLQNMLMAMTQARAQGMPIILVQHVAKTTAGLAPFFNAGTQGVAIHPEILAAAPDAPIVVKQYADAFEQTDLAALLTSLGVERLMLCGMMTQNCVTHTAISKAAERYQVSVLSEACTTREQLLHLIALNAIANRVPCITLAEAFAA